MQPRNIYWTRIIYFIDQKIEEKTRDFLKEFVSFAFVGIKYSPLLIIQRYLSDSTQSQHLNIIFYLYKIVQNTDRGIVIQFKRYETLNDLGDPVIVKARFIRS